MKKKVRRIIKLIKEKHLRVAFAESVTGGLIAYELSAVKGASDFFMGSVVCYNAHLKTKLLSVPKSLINKYSAESAQVTKSMVKNLAMLVDADFYGAVTGLATPDNGSPHPNGTIFLCIFDGTRYYSEKKVFRGKPSEIKEKAFEAIMNLIAGRIK